MIETFRCAFHSGSVLREPYLSLPSLPSSRSTMAIAIAKFESDSESERDSSDLQRCNNNTNNNRTEEDGMNRAYAVFACVPWLASPSWLIRMANAAGRHAEAYPAAMDFFMQVDARKPQSVEFTWKSR